MMHNDSSARLLEICKSGKFYVYTHAKPNGEVFYVGKGVGIRAKDFCRRNDFHKKVVAKYGRDSIKIVAYPTFDEVHAYAVERQLISLLRKAGFHLCNVDPGGNGRIGVRFTPEHREKLRLAGLGQSFSEERRRRISEAGKGRVASDATKAKLAAKKLSESHKAALLASITGRVVSDEVKAKIGASNRGRIHTEQSRMNMRLAHLGKGHDPATKAKRSEALRAAWARRKQQSGVQA